MDMFQDYIVELQKIELFSREEEAALWLAYKNDGDMTARMRILENYQVLVFREAQKLGCMHSECMDVLQEGVVGLMEAAERFVPDKGVAFSVYAMHRVRGRMLDYLRKEGKRDMTLCDETGHSWWEEIPDGGLTMEEAHEEEAFRNSVVSMLGELAPSEQFVMESVCMQGRSVKEVATKMDVSESYIYRLQRQGLKKMRALVQRIEEEWKL